MIVSSFLQTLRNEVQITLRRRASTFRFLLESVKNVHHLTNRRRVHDTVRPSFVVEYYLDDVSERTGHRSSVIGHALRLREPQGMAGFAFDSVG
jgi:hypothetical protein